MYGLNGVNEATQNEAAVPQHRRFALLRFSAELAPHHWSFGHSEPFGVFT